MHFEEEVGELIVGDFLVVVFVVAQHVRNYVADLVGGLVQQGLEEVDYLGLL